MIRRPHPIIRFLLLLLFAAAGWYLLFPALDMPTQELQANTLCSLRAGLALIALSVVFILFYLPCLRVNVADICAAALFAGVTLSRFAFPGLASAVKYDELLAAAMLYLPLRILYMTERRVATVVLALVCGLGIYEGWIGIRQIYGFAYSNHGLFRITGTFFNPGPYAGFIAAAGICGVASIVRWQHLAARVFRSPAALRRQRPGTLIWGITAYLLGWGAAIAAVVVLPSTMSRAAWIAAAVGCGTLVLCELDLAGHIRRAYRARPLRTAAYACIAVLAAGCVVAGAYCLKRPSADGRRLMWKIDTRIMLRNPLCGVGLGNFAGAFGEEQAAYFAAEERPERETQVAGCPESGFNEYLQFGAETGLGGFVLLLLLAGISVASQIRRGSPLGYGLLTAAVFACFSYPWSVLPLRLLFVLLLAGTIPGRHVRMRNKWLRLVLIVLYAGCFAAWPGLYVRSKERVRAAREWSDLRIWMNSERYDYFLEDGGRLLKCLQWDFRFLYDYGYALHKTGDYARSNEILGLGMQISSDPMFSVIAGKNHQALGNGAEAERAFLHAHAMIPDRVYPLYLLAKFYMETGQVRRAHATASRVIGHTPKVESVQTREMREEMRAMLRTLPAPEKEQ